MSNRKILSIPEGYRSQFSDYYNTLQEDFPLGCENGGLEYDINTGVFIIRFPSYLSKKQVGAIMEALRKCNAQPADDKQMIESLESMTGKKVKITESNEGEKNLAVESLKNVSDSLDMLSHNIELALEQVQNLSGQDVATTKLRGLSSIVDSSITDVSELIAAITGMQTGEDMIHEDMDNDDKGVVMDMDDAVNNVDKISKFTDKGENVIIDDKDSF